MGNDYLRQFDSGNFLCFLRIFFVYAYQLLTYNLDILLIPITWVEVG